MEDAFKFLLVAAVIVIGLIRQFKKEAKKNAESKPFMLPDTDMEDDVFTPSSEQGSTYGGYIPEGPQMTEQTTEKAFTPSVKSKSRKTSGSSYIPIQEKDCLTASDTPESDETSEYGIHSAEEAKRAIIWSEILQRKY
ncbi:hypothetical protein [Bacteroides helcogenes]|uniref:Uncharacterized protein n=1 Tax=Bacteroides helcogenes (strain ATCC 35417 / DSM 20613 / JCM 6297 / CCUG 15421 / P 36-108) TaxID=693979 RepID=E6SNH1_BACT6|nr:hypothetical protein [Bacteroides helcogenes]ADV42764.1 hypothetical protein Bache_0742 [Bacteroides helcogenes P 36-108]MDY5239596.1 hypothetical protein [Bacteroides helcogenes]